MYKIGCVYSILHAGQRVGGCILDQLKFPYMLKGNLMYNVLSCDHGMNKNG